MRKNPRNLLLMMTFIMSLVFAVWQVLLNNFVIEKAQFTGLQIGILQSIREVPGLLAVSALLFLIFIKEQVFAIIALSLLCIGVAITGFFPIYSVYI